MATYNRCEVMALAVQSIRAQTCPDWELWIMGDACTDESASVASSFGDPRIHFINLPVNWGEQSGPNNHGCQMARGEYLAFLNHDDLWLPNHLTAALAVLDSTAADLVFTWMEIVQGDGQAVLGSATSNLRYNPQFNFPASSWVFRRELIGAVGPWRSARECYNMPSQDWLFRAWKAGRQLVGIPLITVVAIPSGQRWGSYAQRGAVEHEFYWRRISNEPDFCAIEALRMARDAAVPRGSRSKPWTQQLRQHRSPGILLRAVGLRVMPILTRSGRALASWFGAHPNSVEYWLLFHRKGGFIDHLRHHRGLPRKRLPIPAANPAVETPP